MQSDNGINHLVGKTCQLSDEVVEAIGDSFKGNVTIVAVFATPSSVAFHAMNDQNQISAGLQLEAIKMLNHFPKPA